MLLYHTGYQIIKEPDLYHGRKNADFGQGFYMTPDKDFAYRWAKRNGNELPVVNSYDLDVESLNIYKFNRDIEWFKYIFNNRKNANDALKADVIIGPIANDTIYDTMGIITSGFLEEDLAVKLLLQGPEYKQVVIKSEKAKSQLRWLDSKTLSLEQLTESLELIYSEQDKYLKEIARVLEES